MEFATLVDNFRVTAFVDILGWGSLTDGADSSILRRIRCHESLSREERDAASRLCQQTELASRLDATVGTIVGELNEFACPIGDVIGTRNAERFYKNRHVTFVRSSDNIFLHGSSYRWVVAVVSELLKRGLMRGILFRAGLACGLVVHFEQSNSTNLDTRSRNISIFGDGITSAVAAEKAGAGHGVRVLIHSRLTSLLREQELLVTRPFKTERQEVHDELCWWKDLERSWPNTEHIEQCTLATPSWLRAAASRLEQHSDFDWNRRSESGRQRLDDTTNLLREALAELESETNPAEAG